MKQVEALQWRYATKEFDPNKKLTKQQLEEVMEVLRLTPSSFGLQPWKFYIIEDQGLKEELLPHSFNQHQVVDSSHMVVIAARNEMVEQDIFDYMDNMSQARGVSREDLKGFESMLLGFMGSKSQEELVSWADKQCYIALGNLLTAVANMGIDACPMEGFDKAKYNEILGLTKEGYHAVVTCPLGFRKEEDKYAHMPKVRFERERVVRWVASNR